MGAGAGGQGPSWTPSWALGRGGPSPFITPPSCRGPRGRPRGWAGPLDPNPNPLLMSGGQQEGLSPWPQPYSRLQPDERGRAALKAFAGTFLPAQHPTSHIPQCQGPDICRDAPG